MKLRSINPAAGAFEARAGLRARQAAGRGGRAGTRVREFAVATHWRAVPGRRAARVTALPDMFVSVSYFANHPMRRLCIALLCKLKLRCLFSRLASLNKLRRTERVNPSYNDTTCAVRRARFEYGNCLLSNPCAARAPTRGEAATPHTPGAVGEASPITRSGVGVHPVGRWLRGARGRRGRWAACSRRRARRRRRAPTGLAADGQRP